MTEAKPDPKLGPIYAKRGLYGEALFSANIMLASDPSLAIAWRLRGEALFGLSRYVDAETAFARAFASGGSIAKGTTEWRALCFLQLGDNERARKIIVDYFNSRDVEPDELLQLQARLHELHQG